MFLKEDKWQSQSLLGYMNNNTQYDFPSDFLTPTIPNFINIDDGIKFNAKVYVATQQILYKLSKNIYAGGQLNYINQKFTGKNLAGDAFLKEKGIKDSSRGGYGVTLSYDTRKKNQKLYPKDSSLVDAMVNQFPEFFGTENQYYSMVLDAKNYISGFKSTDVFAMQFYAQYSSENTPDGALASLGSRNILRGFPIGLYKARHMLATQGEYRYRIDNTRFRLTVFGGFANLTGGSKGTSSGNRDQDNGNYYSGGLGFHYILVEKQQMDYRINIAYTNDHEASVYASIKQAF